MVPNSLDSRHTYSTPTKGLKSKIVKLYENRGKLSKLTLFNFFLVLPSFATMPLWG